MSPTLVVGSGGLLGSAVTAELRRRGIPPATPRLEWAKPEGVADRLDRELASVATAARRDATAWTAFWCAGRGSVAAGPEVHQADVDHVRSFARAAAGAVRIAPGRVVLASSAGALYAGGRSWPATEDTPISPIHAYGRSKRVQEALLHDLATTTADLGAVSLRLSNLYGPGQATDKPQGLLSHLVVGTLRRQPLQLYVPLDTSRDYLYVGDAARLAVDAALAAPRTGHAVRIVAAERNHTVAQVLALIGQLMKRRIPYLSIVTENSHRQPPLLSFRSLHRPPASRPRVSLEEGLRRTIDAVTAGLVA